MDATQILKAQIGELMVNNAILMAQVEELKSQIENKDKQTEDKNDTPRS